MKESIFDELERAEAQRPAGCGCSICRQKSRRPSEQTSFQTASAQVEDEIRKLPVQSSTSGKRPVVRRRPGFIPPISQRTAGAPQCHTLSGYSAHHQSVASLPRTEREKIKRIALVIRNSFRPNGRKIQSVRLIGHADRDRQRGANFERKISAERALNAEKAIIAEIKNPAIARNIRWIREAAGATQLVARKPRTESERKRNRRTEICFRAGSAAEPSSRRRFIAVRGDGFVGLGIPRQLPASRGNFRGLVAVRTPNRLPAGRVNVREDVLNVMDRLRLLGSLSDKDHAAEHPTVTRLAQGGVVDLARLPLTVAAIARNQEPAVHHLVAKNFLHQPLSQPVGRGLPNLKADVLMLQDSLHALRLLDDPSFAAERAAVNALTAVTNADRLMPQTLTAISQLKDAIAGFRLGWTPLQADELEAGGDRFGGCTFDFEVTTLCFHPRAGIELREAHPVSIFLPRGVSPDTNKVHVFFSPRGAAGDNGSNDVLVQGLRGATDSSDWILIGVSGVNEEVNGKRRDGWRTIDDAAIAACLQRMGRSPAITAIRLSGHSRGVLGLNRTLTRIPRSQPLLSAPVDRIVILDAPELFFQSGKNVIVYRVNVRKRKDGSDLRIAGAIHRDLNPGCMRAIGYTRLIRNALVTLPTVTVPGEIQGQLLPKSSGPFPPAFPARGCFSTVPARSLFGCQKNLQEFCTTQSAAITAILGNETKAASGRNPEGLHRFVERHNLLRAPRGTGRTISPTIYSHHVFVAEIAHEITGP